MQRPQLDEHHAYYSVYIDRVPNRQVLDVLAEAPAALEGLLSNLQTEEETFAYGPGKWTIREAMGHVVDTERVFSQRAVHIARADPSPLPGMDQNVWASNSNAAARPLSSLLTEFRGLREANTEFFKALEPAILDRRGVASGYEFTVRALAFILVGHELHHRAILFERYLAGLRKLGEESNG